MTESTVRLRNVSYFTQAIISKQDSFSFFMEREGQSYSKFNVCTLWARWTQNDRLWNYDKSVKKRITDEDSSGFWKCYLNYLLENEGGLFLLLQCNYDVNQINISSTFYYDLLAWWSNIREAEDPNNVYKYIIRNNKEIKVDGKSVFYKYYFNMNH